MISRYLGGLEGGERERREGRDERREGGKRGRVLIKSNKHSN